MDFTILLLIFALLVGFYMAWNIGANDVANAMGTSVGSGALHLRKAVIIAAILEFAGAALAGSDVSETVMTGIVRTNLFADSPLLLAYGMLASLLAAGVWLQLASFYGWPVSTTHSIVGAILGFGMVHGGINAVHWGQAMYIVSSWVISPLLGGVLAFFLFSYLCRHIFYTAQPIEAAKKFTPFVVFIVTTVLASFFVFKGLENLHLALLPYQGMTISLLIGLSCTLISYFLINRIPSHPKRRKPKLHYNPLVLQNLEKTIKHLRKAKEEADGNLHFQVVRLLDYAEDLKKLVQRGVDMHRESPEYQEEYQVVERIFAFLQVLTACMMAFAHGANDVANAIGPIAAIVAVVKSGNINYGAVVPMWILMLGGVGIVVGLATWGWRVIETVGKKITELTPSRGFAAEFAAAATILVASKLGLPISTTHTLIGAVIGVGFARGIEAINLNVVKDIISSWIITIPAGAGLSIFFFSLLKFFLS